MLPQITLEIPNEHSMVLSVIAATEQAIEVGVIPVTSRQLPQLDTTLYWSVEQL